MYIVAGCDCLCFVTATSGYHLNPTEPAGIYRNTVATNGVAYIK